MKMGVANPVHKAVFYLRECRLATKLRRSFLQLTMMTTVRFGGQRRPDTALRSKRSEGTQIHYFSMGRRHAVY